MPSMARYNPLVLFSILILNFPSLASVGQLEMQHWGNLSSSTSDTDSSDLIFASAGGILQYTGGSSSSLWETETIIEGLSIINDEENGQIASRAKFDGNLSLNLSSKNRIIGNVTVENIHNTPYDDSITKKPNLFTGSYHLGDHDYFSSGIQGQMNLSTTELIDLRLDVNRLHDQSLMWSQAIEGSYKKDATPNLSYGLKLSTYGIRQTSDSSQEILHRIAIQGDWKPSYSWKWKFEGGVVNLNGGHQNDLVVKSDVFHRSKYTRTHITISRDIIRGSRRTPYLFGDLLDLEFYFQIRPEIEYMLSTSYFRSPQQRSLDPSQSASIAGSLFYNLSKQRSRNLSRRVGFTLENQAYRSLASEASLVQVTLGFESFH